MIDLVEHMCDFFSLVKILFNSTMKSVVIVDHDSYSSFLSATFITIFVHFNQNVTFLRNSIPDQKFVFLSFPSKEGCNIARELYIF